MVGSVLYIQQMACSPRSRGLGRVRELLSPWSYLPPRSISTFYAPVLPACGHQQFEWACVRPPLFIHRPIQTLTPWQMDMTPGQLLYTPSAPYAVALGFVCVVAAAS